MHSLKFQNAASVDIIEGLTSIEAAPDSVTVLNRKPTGARVTIGFRRTVSLPPDCRVNVHYDMDGNGMHRQMMGTPQLTHTLARPGEGAWYHYRLSQWIPAHAVMQVVDSLPTEAAYVRLRTDVLSATVHSVDSGGLPASSANHRHQVES